MPLTKPDGLNPLVQVSPQATPGGGVGAAVAPDPAAHHGVCVFLGSRPDVGVTFLAVMCGARLSVRKRVLLVDADFEASTPDAGSLPLDALARAETLAPLLAPGGCVEEDVSGAFVLPLATITQVGADTPGTALRDVLRAARVSYERVLVDLGDCLDAMAKAVLADAAQVVWVTDSGSDPLDDARAHAQVAGLAPQARMVLVRNRVRGASEPSIEGHPHAVQLPYAPEAAAFLWQEAGQTGDVATYRRLTTALDGLADAIREDP